MTILASAPASFPERRGKVTSLMVVLIVVGRQHSLLGSVCAVVKAVQGKGKGYGGRSGGEEGIGVEKEREERLALGKLGGARKPGPL